MEGTEALGVFSSNTTKDIFIPSLVLIGLAVLERNNIKNREKCQNADKTTIWLNTLK